MKKKPIHSTEAYGAYYTVLPDGSTVWHSLPFCVVQTTPRIVESVQESHKS